jgi:tRNA-splicing ligase RtcB
MTDPGYIVRGRGNPASLHSASHGAGRILSRTQANQLLKEADMRERLREKGVLLDGGGLDEAPQAYKSIETVMLAQADLVDTMGLFYPKVVRME